jgi:hypothetical protein
MKTNRSLFHPSQKSPGAPLRVLALRIARRLRAKYSPCVPTVLLRRALSDATDLAHETGFPLLFLPELAEEKVRIVSNFVGPCDREGTAFHHQYEPAA